MPDPKPNRFTRLTTTKLLKEGGGYRYVRLTELQKMRRDEANRNKGNIFFKNVPPKPKPRPSVKTKPIKERFRELPPKYLEESNKSTERSGFVPRPFHMPKVIE